MKTDLTHYLQLAREALMWKLDGLGEHDLRRPMTSTGTNLLGLVKHTALTEAGYLGGVFGRPLPGAPPWDLDDPNSDMWATAGESSEWVVDLYRRVWAHSDETVRDLPLDAPGEVPWWPPERRQVTLGRILVHMIAETNRHAGHADIVRENIDSSVGFRPTNTNMPDVDWFVYRAHLQRLAERFV